MQSTVKIGRDDNNHLTTMWNWTTSNWALLEVPTSVSARLNDSFSLEWFRDCYKKNVEFFQMWCVDYSAWCRVRYFAFQFLRYRFHVLRKELNHIADNRHGQHLWHSLTLAPKTWEIQKVCYQLAMAEGHNISRKEMLGIGLPFQLKEPWMAYMKWALD